MASPVADPNRIEAICSSCRQSLILPRSNLNQRFTCQYCGFSSFLTADKILTRKEVFVPKLTENTTDDKKQSIRCLIRYFRHGADAPQVGILLDLTTTQVKFHTMVKLEIGSKIYFMLHNRKFIVSIKNISPVRNNSQTTSNSGQYEVIADHETVLTGQVKEKKENPHYLIKSDK